MTIGIPSNHTSAASVADASAQLTKAAGTVALIAGGTDILGVLKTEILPTPPTGLIDLKTIPNLDYITASSTGLKIGALTNLSTIVNSATVTKSYSLLSQAAAEVATPAIRNMATIAGNLCQAVRCWYYRYPDELGGRFVCRRKGGSTCYGVIGNNYYHSIFGGPKGCYAVYPSDLATALVALNATIITNTRTIPIEGFFDSLTGTVLEVGEIVTEIDIPAPASGTKQTFSKAALTKDVEFSMVSVATMVTVSGTTCTAARIAFGGVAPTPLRSTAAENSIVGSAIGPTTAAAAATAAMASATPLQYNAYKVQLAKGLLVQALQA